MSHAGKTLVLGFDGLDFRYLDRYASSLANFSTLRSRGVETSLRSTHPPWTGSAWPSMYTGVDPSHHGVFGFFDYETYPDEGTLITRNDVEVPAVWNYLDHRGEPSIVYNVPVTHPAEKIDGVVVPGYLASEEASGHPEGIRDWLDDAIGEPYTIYSSGEFSDDSAKKLEGYRSLIDRRRRGALALLSAQEWSVAFLQVQKTDAVFHNFDDDEAFRTIYEAADEFLGDVVAAVPDGTTVIVCSDHGIGPVEGYTLYVNEVLAEYGFLEVTDDGGRTTLGDEKLALMGETRDDEPSSPVQRSAVLAQRTLARVGVEPAQIYGLAARIGLGSTLAKWTPTSVLDAATRHVDWRRSRAFCPESTRLGVRINLDGRDEHGIVPADRYDEVRDEIIDLLENLETPDGNPVFEAVRPREDVFDGPHTDAALDVLFWPAEMNNGVSDRLYGRRFVNASGYDHKFDGVFIAAGPAIDDEASIDSLSLTDVAPVTLACSGQPVPTRMTGTVPDGLLDRPVRTGGYGEVEYATTFAAETDEELVTKRLEDLGYR